MSLDRTASKLNSYSLFTRVQLIHEITLCIRSSINRYSFLHAAVDLSVLVVTKASLLGAHYNRVASFTSKLRLRGYSCARRHSVLHKGE